MQIFSYKSLIYEPNLTKSETNAVTIAAHKLCEFQKYRLRKSPLGAKEVAKISDLGFFSDQKSPNMGQLGSNLAGRISAVVAIGSVVCPCWAKNQ